MNNISVGITTYMFPTQNQPHQAIFIKDELEQLKKYTDLQFYLYILQKRTIPFTKKYYQNNSFLSVRNIPTFKNNYISYPRQFFIKQIQKNISKAFIKSLENFKPDIVHAHFLYPTGLIFPVAKQRGIKTVLTIHGTDWYNTINNPTSKNLLFEALNNADSVIAVGKDLKVDISKNTNIGKKLITLGHGVDTEFFNPSDREVKKEQNITKLLTVANLVPKKGIHILLESIKNLDFHNFQLSIISANYESSYKKRILALIEKFNLTERVFLHGSQDRTSLKKFYQTSDIYVQPSINEPFGLSLLEAGACGLPLIATDQGGPQKIVSKKCGILVQPNSVDSLTNGIDYMIKNKHTYTSEDIHIDIAQRFSTKQKANFLNELYSALI
jgi:glycosyltransferase involved in cell wall biosynthesis